LFFIFYSLDVYYGSYKKYRTTFKNKGIIMQLLNLKNAVVALTVITLSACQTTSTPTQTTDTKNTPDINEAQAIASNGLRARIAVSQFTDKSNNSHWWNKEIGNGMADQLTTALVETNRFIVLERANLDSVLAEQDLAASGRISQATGAAYGEIEGAEIAVIASVTEFDDGAKGGSIGGSGLFGDMVSSVAAGFSGTHIAIDLRLVDTRTSRILFATGVEGGSTDYNFTAAATNFGGSLLGGDLSGWSNTPKEKALREIIEKTVKVMLTKIPENYYHYNQNNVTKRQSEPAKQEVAKQQVKATKKIAVPASDRPMTQYQRQDLALAQAQLYCLGYLEEDEDSGRYTPKTKNALKRFQGHNELAITGQLSDETFNVLNDSNCMSKSFASGINALAEALGGGARRTHDENKKKLSEQDKN
jgi:curli biogenesis system outer membrane secretion channel CsgG